MKYTYHKAHMARLGLRDTRRTCIIPDQVYENQKSYDGKTFIALSFPCFRKIRVKLIGKDYGLNTPGTGEMVVRPVRWER